MNEQEFEKTTDKTIAKIINKKSFRLFCRSERIVLEKVSEKLFGSSKIFFLSVSKKYSTVLNINVFLKWKDSINYDQVVIIYGII